MGYGSFLKSKLEKKKQDESTSSQVTIQISPADSNAPSSDGSSSNSVDSSSYTSGMGSRVSRANALDVVKNQVMVHYLYQQQGNSGWRSNEDGRTQGVVLRLSKDNYLCHPPSLADSMLLSSLRNLNVQAAMTIYSPVIRSFLEAMPDSSEIPLMNGLAVQVVPTVEALGFAKTHQFAACIATESMLVVWDDDAANMLQRAKSIEWELIQILWSNVRGTKNSSKYSSKVNLAVKINEKEIEDDASLEAATPKERPTMFINTVLVSISLCVIIGTLGLGLRQLVIELQVEKGYDASPYTRFAYLAFTPIWLFFGMFFFNVLITNIAELLGPISQMNINSKHYSAHPVPRLTKNLPHVTVQCPVYKEGLAAVIAPTIQSIKKAISTYELQGGSANIFVNDDGLQLISEEDCEERKQFYADHGIGWVARPKHDTSPGGFQRRGKFKKASNMNFAMDISCKMEDKLKSLERHANWSSTEEADATAWALDQTLAERGDNVAWADGNIRIGDYILIIDSDTRVPSDCLLDAVSELEISPEVAILQFSSGVMQVANNYFENGITFFTNLVYSAIRYGVANGDVAPFVGHNAMLRWSALQDVATEEDGKIMFWSESHVSEDFDMALRLQIKGYITRLAAWAGDGFKEGVSLTVYDELARWQKYAYGCNELMFHPIRFWPVRGPFTPLFRKFIGSNMPVASKINIISYIGTYYAIGAAWIMTLANYFLIGEFKGYIDKYYVNSWNIWITLIVVFNGLGNLALATLRYRTGERSFLSSLLENFKWLFMLFIFLGGISIHVSQALLAHMFEVNMTWGATAKELEFSNFFVEVPKVLKNFWFSMTFSMLCLALLIVMAEGSFVPYSWQIRQLEAVIPLSSLTFSHMLLPIALNPGLMTFAW